MSLYGVVCLSKLRFFFFKFVLGGNHDRTLEMAFGTQAVNLDKGADNSHLQRCPEIEQWAKDVYDWCAKRYGQENINRLPGSS